MEFYYWFPIIFVFNTLNQIHQNNGHTIVTLYWLTYTNLFINHFLWLLIIYDICTHDTSLISNLHTAKWSINTKHSIFPSAWQLSWALSLMKPTVTRNLESVIYLHFSLPYFITLSRPYTFWKYFLTQDRFVLSLQTVIHFLQRKSVFIDSVFHCPPQIIIKLIHMWSCRRLIWGFSHLPDTSSSKKKKKVRWSGILFLTFVLFVGHQNCQKRMLRVTSHRHWT